MRINGKWQDNGNGIYFPMIPGFVETNDGNWASSDFLVDTGADRSVLCADVLDVLGFPTVPSNKNVLGIGGSVAITELTTRIRLLRDDHQHAFFKSRFAAFTDPAAMDTSVLGRDILRLFAVIVDQPGDVVALIRDRHQYVIQTV